MTSGDVTMTSNRPYLLRAIHEWIVDNDLTPQIVVDAEQEHVQVPAGYVRDGKIVFNISASAVRGLLLGNDWVEFTARFDGTSFDVEVPVPAVLAIIARENGTGMSFPQIEVDPPPPDPKKQPSLRLVK